MRYVVQVEGEDGWSALSRGEHGQPRQELELLADRWRTSLVFANARIRVVEDRSEAQIPAARAEREAMAEALA